LRQREHWPNAQQDRQQGADAWPELKSGYGFMNRAQISHEKKLPLVNRKLGENLEIGRLTLKASVLGRAILYLRDSAIVVQTLIAMDDLPKV
jgi:hypothetical protein